MPEIFISYARPDRPIAEALADDLARLGFSVWWDTELVGSDDFRDVILEELRQAKAVIVIWTEYSVKSKFVRDEAGRALRAGKLIATSVEGFDPDTLPVGFGGLHCHRVTDREATIRAIGRVGSFEEIHKINFEARQPKAALSDLHSIKPIMLKYPTLRIRLLPLGPVNPGTHDRRKKVF